jgi:hypothetical protein
MCRRQVLREFALPHASKAVAGALIAAMATIAASPCPAMADDLKADQAWAPSHHYVSQYGAGYYSGRWAFPFMPYPYYGYRFSCYGNGWPDYPPHACGYFHPE